MARTGTGVKPKFNPQLGRPPVLEWVAPADLQVDGGYQRGMEEPASQTLVRRIAQHWDWGLCLPLVVSRRPDGALMVIDGQHRLAAARMRGDVAHLPCVVGSYPAMADEAARFVRLNRQRRPLSRLDLFRAAVASEDERAVAIAEALTDAGLSLAPHGNYTSWKPGMVSHIGGIERVWDRMGPPVARRALVALAEGFRGQVLQYGGTLFSGIAAVCLDEQRAHGRFDGARFERFTAMLGRQPQGEWVRDIQRWFADGGALFLGDAPAGLMRREWRRTIDPRGAAALERAEKAAEALAPPVRRDGEPDWKWCEQCDARRTAAQAAACASRFCKLKG